MKNLKPWHKKKWRISLIIQIDTETSLKFVWLSLTLWLEIFRRFCYASTRISDTKIEICLKIAQILCEYSHKKISEISQANVSGWVIQISVNFQYLFEWFHFWLIWVLSYHLIYDGPTLWISNNERRCKINGTFPDNL